MIVNKDRQQKYISLFLESKSPQLSAKDIRRYTKHLEEGLQFSQEFIDKCEAAGMHYDLHLMLKFFAEHLRLCKKEPRGRVKHKIELMHEFFDWRITEKGDEAMNKAQQQVEADGLAESVSVTNQEAMPQQKGGAEMEAGQKASKQIKLTIYPDKALEADIRLLAGIDGIPVSKFILKLIQQEVNSRREDLNTIRAIRAKRG